MAIELTKEEELKLAVNQNMVEGAKLSKRYTDQEVGKIKGELSDEFKQLTGANKEEIDTVISILDEADLDKDGNLDIANFHRNLVARIAKNEVGVESNTKETEANKLGLENLGKALAKEISDRQAQGVAFDEALGLVKTAVTELSEDLELVKKDVADLKISQEEQNLFANDTRALAISNQNAIKAVTTGLADTVSAMEAVYGFEAGSTATNAY